MSSPSKRVEPAELEAAAWHARLGKPRVSPETIQAFFAWRQAPENAAAYRRVEDAWSATGELRTDPETLAALDEILARKPTAKRGGSFGALAGLVAVAGAALLVVSGWVWMDGRGVYTTSVGELRSVQLADGSSVRLDTGSRVRVRFTGGERTVQLEEGQALFDVAHDPRRPFVVEAGGAQVTAVGTVFDVKRAGSAVEVTLVSGVVDVASEKGRAPQRMRAGHQARVMGSTVRTIAVDVSAETSWSDGRVVFRDTPLEQAVAEVNRYLTQPIVLDAPTLEGESVNGVFKTGDRDAFVSAASATLGLRASPGRDGAVRLSAEK